MPNMSGMELAGKLLYLRSDIPIILCTGYSALVSEQQAKDAGIKAYYMKPIERREFANMIRQVLDEEKDGKG